MIDFKKSWNVEMAMAVLGNKEVDSDTWSEAVEWLLLYGPPEVKEPLEQASSTATSSCYPELTPSGYTPDGEPCYDIDKIADTLGISKEEVLQRIAEKEAIHGKRHLFDEEETSKLQ